MASFGRSGIKEDLPHPQGANWDGRGANFALFSASATKIELCLFGSSGNYEAERIELPEYTNRIFHGYLPEVGPGSFYGYRVHGACEPEAGTSLQFAPDDPEQPDFAFEQKYQVTGRSLVLLVLQPSQA